MDLEEQLKKYGLKKRFRPYLEVESRTLMIETTKYEIKDGYLRGTEIARSENGWCVWTDKTKLAKTYATQLNLKHRVLTGEAIIWVPDELADQLLPRFGARVKTSRVWTEAQKQASRNKIEKINLANKQSSVEKDGKNEASVNLNAGEVGY